MDCCEYRNSRFLFCSLWLPLHHIPTKKWNIYCLKWDTGKGMPLTEAGPKSFISDRRRMCAWNIDFSLKRLPTYAEGFCRWKFRVWILYIYLDLTRSSCETCNYMGPQSSNLRPPLLHGNAIVLHKAGFWGEVRTSAEIVLHLPWEFLHLPWKVMHLPLGKFQW
jgi:hypothetical protein